MSDSAASHFRKSQNSDETSLKSDEFLLDIMPKADTPLAEAVEPRKL
jgi:hypothetical protein